MKLTSVVTTSLLSSVVTSSPLARRQAAPSSVEPCSLIHGLVAAQNTTGAATIPAQAAWDCLQSVPLNKTAALDLIHAIKPFVRWQSTLPNLANPPAEYYAIQGAYDPIKAIANIEDQLNSNAWDKEYDFGIALYEAFHAAHDGHFYYNPDVIGKIFSWSRPLPLVSISEDGERLPAPFVYADILAASQAGNSTFKPSAISKINGGDAEDFLANLSQQGSLQDRDALYNTVFYNLAQISLGGSGGATGMFSGGGRGRLNYPGATTELEFVNGTKLIVSNTARVLVDFKGIKSGADLYQKYFTWPDLTVHLDQITPNSTSEYGPPSMSPRPTAPATPPPTSTPAPGYPKPIIKQRNNLLGGYYLDGVDGYEDVAVLSVPSFVSVSGAQIEFQQVAMDFLAQAKAAGKTKLIVDVSANGGGTILQGYDLFKQLFPAIEPYATADRFRATESVKLIGEVLSERAGKYPREPDQPIDVVSMQINTMNYRSDLVADTAGPFGSWPEKVGPEVHQNDNVTARFRWNFEDPLVQYNSGGIFVHGFGPLAETANNEPPFQAEDIVILYDGYCASTCTIFSELMRKLANVKTIAIGGRPNANQIQAVGGVKGTNVLTWSYIQSLVEASFNYSTPEQHPKLLTSELMEYSSYLPFYRAIGGAAGVNFRDGIRKGDEDQIPLQFRYEEADCRIFYEAAHTVDVSSLWRRVADVRWKGGKCVAGGFNGANRAVNARVSTSADLKEVHLPAQQVQELKSAFDLRTDHEFDVQVDGFMLP